MPRGPFVNRAPDYTDLDLDFFANPTTKDISIRTGEEAIKRSVRNIIFTNFYDRLFQPWIGSNIRSLLFENVTSITAIMLVDVIRSAINNYEPRVRLTDVRVKEDIDNNGYNVTLEYIILNRELPIVTTIFLERIR